MNPIPTASRLHPTNPTCQVDGASLSAADIALLRVLSNQPCRAAAAPVRIQPSAGATTSATSSIERRMKG
jgi:hypothetical protein